MARSRKYAHVQITLSQKVRVCSVPTDEGGVPLYVDQVTWRATNDRISIHPEPGGGRSAYVHAEAVGVAHAVANVGGMEGRIRVEVVADLPEKVI